MKIFRVITVVLVTLSFFIIYMGCSDTTTENDENPIITDTVIFTPDGGTYTFESGVTVTVPVGTVNEDTPVSLSILSKNDIWSLYDYDEENTIDFLKIFSVTSEIYEFNKAITFTFSGFDSVTGFIPIPHTINFNTKTHNIEECETVYDPQNDRLDVTVNTSECFAIEKNYAWFDNSASKDCREGLIKVSAGDYENVCQEGECQVVESDVEVTFLSCPDQPVESAVLTEYNGKCSPFLNMTATGSDILVNETAKIDIEANFADKKVENASIILTKTGPGTLDAATLTTDSLGNAFTMFNASEVTGIVTITAESDIRSLVRGVEINGEIIEAFFRTEHVEKTVEVKVQKVYYDITLAVDCQNSGILGTGDEAYAVAMCNVNYSANIDFRLEPLADGYHVISVAGTQQVGSITPLDDHWLEVIDIYGPADMPIDTLDIFCYKETDSLLSFVVFENDCLKEQYYTEYAHWDIMDYYVLDPEDEVPEIISQRVVFYIVGFVEWISETGDTQRFKVPLNEQEFIGTGYVVCWPTGPGGDGISTYTLKSVRNRSF